MITAILSTTVLPMDGNYTVRTLTDAEVSDLNLAGITHYIGHPATKSIVENMGAIPAPSKLFEGIQAGQTCLAVSIKQGMSTRATLGHTEAHQEVTPDMLQFRLITRADVCLFCKQEARLPQMWHCSSCGAC
jgi:hypothetical protein